MAGEPLEVSLLGPVQASQGGSPVALGGTRRAALLALLAMHAPRTVSRSQLLDGLWGEDPPDTARNALQVHISALRKTLGKDAIATSGDGYRLAEGIAVDAHQFVRAQARGREQFAAGDPGAAATTLTDALRLWRGTPLSGLEDIPFASVEATRLEELRLGALTSRIETDLALGRHQEVIPELQSLVGQYPLREGLRQLLMQALYRADRQADALAVYDTGRRTLRDELGVEPSPTIRALHQRLLSQTETAPPVRLPASTLDETIGRDEDLGKLEQVLLQPSEPSPRLRDDVHHDPKAASTSSGVLTHPAGTIALLFTDVEGSTKTLQRLGPADYAAAIEAHRGILRDSLTRHGGFEVDSTGDSFFAVFLRVDDAVEAASHAQLQLQQGPLRVRMGIHVGTPLLKDGRYVGMDVNRAARVAAAAHGGQILVTEPVRLLSDPATTFRRLGRHHLKDIPEPELLFQVGDHPFPPPMSRIPQTSAGAVPSPVSAAIGRDRDISAVQALFVGGGQRLITLLGPGGVGKTRLAVECANAAGGHFTDGVCWVSLAALTDTESLPSTLVQALGVADPTMAAWEAVKVAVWDRRLLLVLDNVEHLLPAAAQLIAELLSAAPSLVVLATSRVALHLSAEQRYPVDPLSSTDQHDMRSVEAAPACVLFLQRVRAVQPRLELTAENASAIAQLCQRLDGLPLALEIAAARSTVLSPTELLAGLDAPLSALTSRNLDTAERHRSLRATLQWSVGLLTDAERRLLARLSVFRGGFDVAAAHAVADESIAGESWQTLDLLTTLVDASLLTHSDTPVSRFSMLETVREFAAELLAATGQETAVRSLHASHFAWLFGSGQGAPWPYPRTAEEARRHTMEQHNVRAAVQHAQDTGHQEQLAKLVLASVGWHLMAGLFDEARSWLRALADAPPGPEARVAALVLLSVAELATGHPDRAQLLLEEALSEPAMDSAPRWRAMARAHYAMVLGDFDLTDERIPALADAALVDARGVDDQHVLGYVLSLGGVVLSPFDAARGRLLLEEAVILGRETPDHMAWFAALANLAEVSLAEGDAVAARDCARAALALAIADFAPGAVSVVDLLGASLVALGELDEAAPILREGLALARQFGDQRMTLELVGRLAVLEAARGNYERAMTLLAANEKGFERLGVVRCGSDQWLIDHHLPDLRSVLPPEAYTAARARGERMSAAELMDFAEAPSSSSAEQEFVSSDLPERPGQRIQGLPVVR